LAAGTTIVASVLVVLIAFRRIADLQSLETREAIARFVADQSAGGLGLTVDEVVTTLRVLTMVAAACAAAAVVLAFFVLRRHAAAQLALTVVAVPLFLAGLASGAIASSVAAAAAASLWFEPSRTWLRGASAARPAGGLPAPPTPPPPGAGAPPDRHAATPPSPHPGPYAAPTPHAYGAAAATMAPPAPGWPTERPVRPPRPRAVTAACVLTWVASGFVALLMGATGVLLAADREFVLQRAHEQNPELRAQGVSDGLLVAATFAMLAAVVLWCVAAAVVAVLVLRGVEWARILLVISAALSAALSLIATVVGALPLVLTLAASTAALALLVRADVRPFFRSR
jgi:hypothetical protein